MSLKINSDLIGIFYILLASLSVSILPNSAKFAMSDGAGMITLMVTRGIIGLVLLISLLLITRTSFFLPKSLILISIINGLLALGMIAALYAAIIYIDISLSILILCLFPVVIAVISHLRGVEIVSLIQWLCIIFVLIGLSLLILSDKSSISFLGIFFSLIGMIFAVIITFLSEKMTKEIGALTTTFYLNAWGLLFLLLILTSFSNYLPPQSNMGWIAMALNGVFNIGAWVFFFAGMQRIGATRASMLTSVDPIFSAILAYLLFNQFFSIPQWVGFFLVIISLFCFEYFKKKVNTLG
jgi:drug/metabolite transporter (DMT)-like permease